jgi:hypothetical protein
MSCRVELEGEVCRDPALGGDAPAAKASQTPFQESDKAPANDKQARTRDISQIRAPLLGYGVVK